MAEPSHSAIKETVAGAFLPLERLSKLETNRARWRFWAHLGLAIITSLVFVGAIFLLSFGGSRHWMQVVISILWGVTLTLRCIELWKMAKGPYLTFPEGSELGFLVAEDGFGFALVDGSKAHRMEGMWTPWSDLSIIRRSAEDVVAVKSNWKTVPIPRPLGEIFIRKAGECSATPPTVQAVS